MTTQKMEKENKKMQNIKNSIDITTLIKMQLIQRKIKQKQIAEDLNVVGSAVSLFVNGHRKSRKFNKWVYENLGIAI
jgi:predicted XRE-type DNA-binding protein